MQCSLNGTQRDSRATAQGHDPIIKPKSSVERPGYATHGKCKRIAAKVIAVAATRTSRVAHEGLVSFVPPDLRALETSSGMEHRRSMGERTCGATVVCSAAHNFFAAIAF